MSNTRFLRRCQTLSSVCFLGLVITTTQSDRQPNLAGTAVPASHGGTTAPPDPAILEGGSPGGGTRNSYGGAGIRDSFPVSTRIVESQRRGDARSGWGAADLAHVELRDPRRAAPSGVDSESGELPLRTQSERVPTHWRDPRELPYGTGPHRPVKRFDDIAEIAESMNDSLFVLFDPPPPTNASENRGTGVRVDAVRMPHARGTVPGFMVTAPDPVATVSVYEPGQVGGCLNATTPTSIDGRTTTSASARAYHCHAAVNAGFFNTGSGECHGNLVSNGRVVQADGAPNANFGILANGSIVVGYINNSLIDEIDPPFVQLIAGVIWLVRDGVNYVNQSVGLEYGQTQEGTSLLHFAELSSARVALGHDADGSVRVVQLNGKTNQRGIDLVSFADLLIENGFVNAINLDGGGSATTAINGTAVSELSDECPTDECLTTRCPENLRGRWWWSSPINGYTDCHSWCQQFKCERKVTTIVCVHDPLCYDCDEEGGCDTRPCQSSSTTTTGTMTSQTATSTTETSSTTTVSTTITSTFERVAAADRLNAALGAAAGWQAGFIVLLCVLLLGIVLVLARTRDCYVPQIPLPGGRAVVYSPVHAEPLMDASVSLADVFEIEEDETETETV